ncbi:MAG: hypothetical protein IJ794_14735 [Lachnospiraceae bacterium]|nr:hypothetical protein [Lachnospiraceae bacterium]
MAERALAHIEKIEWIRPIEGADNIVLIGVLGWVCIAKKEEFKQGDMAVYIEIDSKCPAADERFAFLAGKHYKVKTMKLGKFNVISQGLALPLELFPELQGCKIGEDVTEALKITYSSEEDLKRKTNQVDPDKKYQVMASRHPKLAKTKWFRFLMQRKWGKRLLFFFFGKKTDRPKGFPEWIVKTDEVRIENAPIYLSSTDKWIKTEKCDGTSCTYAVDRSRKGKDAFEFIVCSRNVRQLDRDQKTWHESNIYWELADKYHIEEILTKFALEKGYNRVVLQGEGVGDVQGNPYKLKENELYVFNLVIEGARVGTLEMAEFCEANGLKTVPIIDVEYTLPTTMEEMKLEADGFSVLNPKVKREGFVYRSQDGKQSFKNVSREYLLKHNG